MGYTREEIRLRLEKMAEQMPLFYQKSCINYRGKTTDTDEYYTEVIAQWLAEHLDLLDQIKTISRKASYLVEGHDGIPEDPESNREEELIAMAMKRYGELPVVGKVLDYQTPLKDTKSDKAGKIDLLAYDGSTLRILELKEPDSKETMLRCVLEGYTYLKTADKAKLLADFGLPADTKVEACPFVFHGGAQWEEMRQERPCLWRLMTLLESKPYYITEEYNGYTITEE